MNDVVEKINALIASGRINTRFDENRSSSCLVWGARTAECDGIIWAESKGRFLGGGLYESYGYTLTHNNQSIRIADYITSLRMLYRWAMRDPRPQG